MKIVVLGGSGHIGSYLVPKLIRDGHSVISITRSDRQPYTASDPAWQYVEKKFLDRSNTNFNANVAKLNADVVVDLIAFDLDAVKGLVTALKPTKLSHYLFCSSIWAHGHATLLPSDPNAVNKEPLDSYGKEKVACENYLKAEYRQNHFPATIVMPGQVSGPGWIIINPVGNLNPKIFQDIANGQAIALPNFGMETLHHVHADDVAQVFYLAIKHRNQSLGESFHAVVDQSITLYGFAQAMYRSFHQAPQINFLPWPEWKKYMEQPEFQSWHEKYADRDGDVEKTYYHIARSGNYSIANATNLLHYHPRHTILETINDSVHSYIERGVIQYPEH